ncbi:hypothetical protein GCM10023155_44760 [Bremerella cremea]
MTKPEAGVKSTVIYGFSNRDAYEQFCKGSQLALKPNTLVKGYLCNELDATGPEESCKTAAGFRAVLEAQESGASRVTADYQLSLTGETDCYRPIEPCAHQDDPTQVLTLT